MWLDLSDFQEQKNEELVKSKNHDFKLNKNKIDTAVRTLSHSTYKR